MLNSPLYKAIAKSMSGKLATYIVQFVFLAIYARVFSPQDFGIIASIQVFVIFFDMLSNVGIGPAIINEDEFGKNKRNGIFSFTIILAVLISLLFYFFSYGINLFYGGYEYQNIAILVSIGILFNSANTVSNTALVKDAKFITIAKIDILSEILALGGVLYLSCQGGGVIALATKPAILSINKFIFTYIASKNTSIGRPKLGTELSHVKSILEFSSYQFCFNFINYFSRNLDNILVAKFFGMNKIGIYDKSYQLMRYPLLLTTYAMTPAIQPILTKQRHDRSIIIREHNNLANRLLMISVPISTYIFTNSHEIVLFLFGNQWGEVSELIRVFCFMIPIQAVLSTSGSFFQVLNKPKMLFITGLITAAINIIAISIGIYLGTLVNVASCLVVSFFLGFLITYHILFSQVFYVKIKIFYFNLLVSLLWVSIPSLIYVVLQNLLVSNYEFKGVTALTINALLGGGSLIIFKSKLKQRFLKDI